ncbi:MAG: DEAD/DEAH box helicase family protein [Pseudomonadota bacterium]|nr:DEAD/DEAH box helicase family protein [Pseudomonadota bacterium]
MSRAGSDDPMALSNALTRLTQEVSAGLEAGSAPILERVTPVTAELLLWWFGEAARRRRRNNFHPGQRQAILNVIVAHEVIDSRDPVDLNGQLRAGTMMDRQRPGRDPASDHPAHPQYCLRMPAASGKTWVLQALLLWQMLNRTAALDEGRDDPRHSRHFLVVAPGLIDHERLLRALVGRCRPDGGRDFASSDIARLADLLVPPAHRSRVNRFVRGNVCNRYGIGLEGAGNGLLAVTDWRPLCQPGEPIHEPDRRLSGGRLEATDPRREHARLLAFLAALPDLVVFNYEAFPLRAAKHAARNDRAEWQKCLSRIAHSKGRRFVQIDFSATPYEHVGIGRNRTRRYFPHVVLDFDLKSAICQGLVKSPVLERRTALDALPLALKAVRDHHGHLALAEGQRLMLRIGLEKLQALERNFATIDAQRRPTMLVMCEDPRVVPLVARYLQREGLHQDDILTIESGRKTELDEAQWAGLRQRLFDIRQHAGPRVIVSTLMLREGLDVDNLCVIVPLRASRGPVLMEQTIGRGLRLMWREPEYADIKRENRERISRREPPGSSIDVLSIVEHPAFHGFYDELLAQGLAGQCSQ